MAKIIGCKVFSVSTADNVKEDMIGAALTKWIETNPFLLIEDRMMVQSDNYISIMIFYSGKPGKTNPLDF